MDVRPDQVEAYCRLSRADILAPGGMEQKWADRKAIARRLAASLGIPLADDRIICEQESGATIDDRAEFAAILERVKSGKTKVLISPYQDRLGRPDLGDLDRIEKAFLRHGATLVTAEWARGLEFGPSYRAHDALLFRMQAVAANARLAQDGLKRSETNISKVRRNHRHGGGPPFGYLTVHPPVDADGRRVLPTEADIDTGHAYRSEAGVILWHTHRPHPDQYPILCEMCRRALAGDSMHGIERDLNERGIPTDEGGRWWDNVVRTIVLNPFNAGRLAKRWGQAPDGRQIKLKPHEYIIAETDGDWERPITMAEWQEIVLRVGDRASKRGPKIGLLTGVLRCARGESMSQGQTLYRCKCANKGHRHAGSSLAIDRIEALAREVVEIVISLLPAEDLKPRSKAQKRTGLHADLTAARQAEERAARAVDNLIGDPEAFIAVMEGEKGYSEALRRAERQRMEARAKRDALEAELARPSAPDVLPALRSLRGRFDAAWEDADNLYRRELLRMIVERIQIDPIPDGKRYVRSVSVTFHDWVTEELPQISVPPLRKLNFSNPHIAQYAGSRKGKTKGWRERHQQSETPE